MLSHRLDIDPDQVFSSFDLTRRSALIAAVSGGSDSLAMLLLLQRWLERKTAAPRLVAITVDHQLRPESREEAATVGRLCAARGIAHRTLTWIGEKPPAGIPAAARLARYHLLSEAAREAGSDIVITGHTADDQAETVAMRQARGDGRGLAGMAPATLFDGKTWIVRPLLGARREKLRQFLRGEGVAWIEDPTNRDTVYERARTRRHLQQAAGDQVEALLEETERAGATRMVLGSRAAALVEKHTQRPMQGLVRLAPDFARAGDEEVALLAFRALLAVTGGVEHLPNAERAAALLHRLRSGRLRATLSRTVIDARKSGVLLYRERRGLPEDRATPGAIWDGRYEIVEQGDASQDVLAPLSVSGYALDTSPPVPEGKDGSQARRPSSPLTEWGRGVEPEGRDGEGEWETEHLRTVAPSIISAVRATMPQPVRSNIIAVPVLAPWRLFLPSFDLALARTIARLIGAPNIPNPPFPGHNREEG